MVEKINLLRARRAEQSRGEREDKDYNTHLAKISSAGQGPYFLPSYKGRQNIQATGDNRVE